VIWQLFAYRRRGRRIDPGPAIPSADRAAGILPLAKVRWRRLARRGAGRAIMAEVLQRHVFARPDFAMGGPHGGAPRGPIAGGLHGGGAPHFAMGGPHGGGGPHGTRCASERGLAMGSGRPAEHRFTVGGSGKSVARCHRTVLAYWKFESISLQQRVMQTIGSSTLLGSTAAEDCEAAQNPCRGLAADPRRGLNITPGRPHRAGFAWHAGRT